ncbi:MAG: aldo/keto reductase [Aerococcus sp.]|nr:aldo/keto reductase [Aerococcus sp.]
MSVLEKTLTLNNGVEIPIVGLGTWKATKQQAYDATDLALKHGYRHIDTAFQYFNQEMVGKAINDSTIPRDHIFITSKIQAACKRPHEVHQQVDEILYQMKQDYLDLILVHAPRPWEMMSLEDPYHRYYEENREVWAALEEDYRAGKIRAIGVSNFEIDDLNHLLPHVEVTPAVNQIKYHIGHEHTNDELVNYCTEHEIALEGYSPLQTGGLLDNPEIASLTDKYHKSIAQIALRYVLDKGLIVLPKSTHEQWIQQNSELDFTLEDADREMLDHVKL